MDQQHEREDRGKADGVGDPGPKPVGVALAAASHGAEAGFAVLLGAGATLFLLGLVLSTPMQLIIGARYRFTESVPLRARLVRAALAPWAAEGRIAGAGGYLDYPVWWGVSLAGILVLLAFTWAARRYVRSRVPAVLRLRTLALAGFAVTCALGAGAATASGCYFTTWFPETGSPAAASRFPPLPTVLSALVLAGLFGTFLFDVVALLPRPVAIALRQAGAFVLGTFLLAALALPVFVIARNAPGAVTAEDFAAATLFSPSVGSMVIPAAFGARLHTGGPRDGPPAGRAPNEHAGFSYFEPPPGRQLGYTPFGADCGTASSSGTDLSYGGVYRWPAVVKVIDAHPSARLTTYAKGLGRKGVALAVALSALTIAVFAWLTARLCRLVDAGDVVRGMALGLLQGACVAVILVPVAWLSRFGSTWWFPVDVHGAARPPAPVPDDFFGSWWGVPWASLAWTAVMLLALGAVVGLAVGVSRARGTTGDAAPTTLSRR